MNFKTTILLIALLAVAGVVLFFTRDRSGGTSETSVTTPDATKKLLDVNAADITKVVVTPTNDKPIALERAGGMNWRLTQPIAAPADSSAAESLVSALAELTSRSKIDAGSDNAQVTGLDQPNFRVELTTKDGKTTKLAVGNKSGTGGNAYVRLNDEKQADLVPAEFYDSLDKPASSFRSTQVVDVKTPEISEVQVHSAKGDLSLAKTSPEAWQINAGPTTMPADQTEVSDLLVAVTGLRATEYTPDDLSDATAAKYQLDNPMTTVTLVSNPVTTQPAMTRPSTQRTTTTIKFGRYDDIQKRNVLVATSASPAIAKVPASTLTQLDKRPLDLRDRKVLTVNADQVESIAIAIDKPSTTQPTTKPAEQRTVTLVRRHDQPATRTVAATQPATTQPTTQVASTQGATTAPSTQPVASTQPVEPPTKWQLATGPGLKIAADDIKVDDVLSLFAPLRAEKFLESNPTTQSAEPHDRYTVTLTTGGSSPVTYQLNLIDRGASQPAVADYNGLLFELPRTLIERVSEKFEKGATPSTPRREPPGGPPGLE